MAKTKTTQPRTKKDTSEATAPKLVMLTGRGHRVSRNVTARADCGVRMTTGWRYGTTEDVTCKGCLEVEGQ